MLGLECHQRLIGSRSSLRSWCYVLHIWRIGESTDFRSIEQIVSLTIAMGSLWKEVAKSNMSSKKLFRAAAQ